MVQGLTWPTVACEYVCFTEKRVWSLFIKTLGFLLALSVFLLQVSTSVSCWVVGNHNQSKSLAGIPLLN